MPRYVNPVPRKKVAIVGSGCAGIGALWALNRSHHDVYLYEADSRLGGHTNTVEFKKGKYSTNVDTGFIVMNTATYPNLMNFLKYIGVEVDPTEMTFGVSRDYGKYEWSGTNLNGLFCQVGNFFSPSHWRMIYDIVRFNQYALDILIADDEYQRGVSTSEETRGAVRQNETIGEYLDREGYSGAFKDNYLIPMTAAVWSTSPDKCALEFPAITLVRFMWNHHLLSTVAARPQWMTVREGSKAYIDTVMKGYPSNHLFLNTKVKSVKPTSDGRVELYLGTGKVDTYDHVILAIHGDQAYELTKDYATEDEKTVLSYFKTSENYAVLHSDLSLMPKCEDAWSSWNYLTLSAPGGVGNIDQVSLTYNMNILQHIPRDVFGDVLVTLNPLHRPAEHTVQGKWKYTHPLYTATAVRGQKLLTTIQNKRGISYCGAWTKYGFHEDGFSSGLKVSQDHLGARIPFVFQDSTFSRGRKPNLGMADLLIRVLLQLIYLFVIMPIEVIFGVNRGSKPLLINGVNGYDHEDIDDEKED
ncbi:FAD/NAD(P)-binding domain-containing protein [Zalerion maritima]|uniref:FAD/NAD(P)-binding domain-containing protein n=1 Tax=Zalerion maritima TaxID=339359 RepID=A0AAD5WYE8_9PEZI|nr:FAD/NAD(P)-binding domain-containing protein [Zalerion maritima]